MGRARTDAAELLNLKPDVILVSGRRAVAVLQQQTRQHDAEPDPSELYTDVYR